MPCSQLSNFLLPHAQVLLILRHHLLDLISLRALRAPKRRRTRIQLITLSARIRLYLLAHRDRSVASEPLAHVHPALLACSV